MSTTRPGEFLDLLKERLLDHTVGDLFLAPLTQAAINEVGPLADGVPDGWIRVGRTGFRLRSMALPVVDLDTPAALVVVPTIGAACSALVLATVEDVYADPIGGASVGPVLVAAYYEAVQLSSRLGGTRHSLHIMPGYSVRFMLGGPGWRRLMALTSIDAPDAGPSPAHFLGGLAAGLASQLDEHAVALHALHAEPGSSYRNCLASTRCQTAAKLVAEAERVAGRAADAAAFADHLALYAESVAL